MARNSHSKEKSFGYGLQPPPIMGTTDDFDKQSIIDQLRRSMVTSEDTGGGGLKYRNYSSKRRIEKDKTDYYRKGPAPIEDSDALTKSTLKATYGTLDSDVEDLDFEEVRHQNSKNNYYNKLRITTNERGDNLASCRALIVYFSKLAKSKDEEELIDLNFVESLLDNGADINFPDKHGQTALHEIARGWHPDVARFAIEHGADLNKCDSFGRTPLHLAAAVDYDDMVQFLVDNGADLGAKTYGEEQTAMHYAAKNNAASSIKVMLRLGAAINDRDYKKRTPLFVAAETARTDAARFLIENGAPAGVYDSSGTPCLSLMIEKMPNIAIEAVEQFHLLDLAFRKHYYYLSYLEPDPHYMVDYIPESKRERKEQRERRKAEEKLIKDTGQSIIKKEKSYAKTPLEVIVQYDQLDIIMHPVFQRLLHVKWNLFGKRGSAKMLALNLLDTLIWTILGILLPRDHQYYYPFADNWWRLALELFGVLMTVYFIVMELTEVRNNEKKHNHWRQWRTRHMEKDLEYCHPRWPEERQYLTSELLQIRGYQRTYFRDPWNIIEWISYSVVLTLIFTRILAVATSNMAIAEFHPKVYALGLIVIWLRFMRSCRVFQTLGPFIAILGSVVVDTAKFSFLLFEFFIPYTVGFWIIFGGPENASKMIKNDWENFNDLTFSVFGMTLMDNYDFNGLVAVDRLMAQILCGSYLALAGVVCLNMYIALLSDTFARVYSQAKATAVMQQAKTIIALEGKLNKFHKSKYAHYMLRECSPQEVYTRDESSEDGSYEGEQFDRIGRQIAKRIDTLEENIILRYNRNSGRKQKSSDNQNNKTESGQKKNFPNRLSYSSFMDGDNSSNDSDGGPPPFGEAVGRGSSGCKQQIKKVAEFQREQFNDLQDEIANIRSILSNISSLLLAQQGDNQAVVALPKLNAAPSEFAYPPPDAPFTPSAIGYPPPEAPFTPSAIGYPPPATSFSKSPALYPPTVDDNNNSIFESQSTLVESPTQAVTPPPEIADIINSVGSLMNADQTETNQFTHKKTPPSSDGTATPVMKPKTNPRPVPTPRGRTQSNGTHPPRPSPSLARSISTNSPLYPPLVEDQDFGFPPPSINVSTPVINKKRFNESFDEDLRSQTLPLIDRSKGPNRSKSVSNVAVMDSPLLDADDASGYQSLPRSSSGRRRRRKKTPSPHPNKNDYQLFSNGNGSVMSKSTEML
ncbi:uncharacterized protein [Clytia hemisphaerica]|uniref:Ion transport domain-containing protein n=1 Tax=Clytia hemisphaerica TaxID=252671 RepID=A0A7M5V9G4_9CNID